MIQTIYGIIDDYAHKNMLQEEPAYKTLKTSKDEAMHTICWAKTREIIDILAAGHTEHFDKLQELIANNRLTDATINNKVKDAVKFTLHNYAKKEKNLTPGGAVYHSVVATELNDYLTEYLLCITRAIKNTRKE